MSDLPDTLEILLDPPIEARGGQCSKLVLTEPRGRQVRDAERKLDQQLSEASVTDYEMALVQAVSGALEDVVRDLPIVTLGRAMGYLQAFIDDGVAEENAAIQSEDEAGGVDLDSLPGVIEVAIDPPVTWNKMEYPMITLRQPKASELRQARQHMKAGVSPFTVRSYQMALLTAVSGLPPAVVDGLRIRTLTEATRHLARFIRAGRQAGKASPAS